MQALVGIAFSLGFIIGPLIGAMFAVWAKQKSGQWFIIPALFAFLLSVADLIFFTIFFKESLPNVSFICYLRAGIYRTVSFSVAIF